MFGNHGHGSTRVLQYILRLSNNGEPETSVASGLATCIVNKSPNSNPIRGQLFKINDVVS